MQAILHHQKIVMLYSQAREMDQQLSFTVGQVWWHAPLIPALGRQRQRQVDICEFEVSLVYKASSRTQRNLVSKNQKAKKYLFLF